MKIIFKYNKKLYVLRDMQIQIRILKSAPSNNEIELQDKQHRINDVK